MFSNETPSLRTCTFLDSHALEAGISLKLFKAERISGYHKFHFMNQTYWFPEWYIRESNRNVTEPHTLTTDAWTENIDLVDLSIPRNKFFKFQFSCPPTYTSLCSYYDVDSFWKSSVQFLLSKRTVFICQLMVVENKLEFTLRPLGAGVRGCTRILDISKKLMTLNYDINRMLDPTSQILCIFHPTNKFILVIDQCNYTNLEHAKNVLKDVFSVDNPLISEIKIKSVQDFHGLENFKHQLMPDNTLVNKIIGYNPNFKFKVFIFNPHFQNYEFNMTNGIVTLHSFKNTNAFNEGNYLRINEYIHLYDLNVQSLIENVITIPVKTNHLKKTTPNKICYAIAAYDSGYSKEWHLDSYFFQ